MDGDEVSPEEAAELVAAGALLLDVREPEEWDAGRAPEALHIPLGQLVERLGEVPEGREVVCVCRVGGRSAQAVRYLVGQGYSARNLAGGMLAWEAAELAVVSDDGQGAVL